MRSGKDTVEDSGVSEAERTRISSAKLLSSPSRALTASKSNTNWRQQAQCYWGRCAFHGQAREGVAAHLRERGLCSLVWCFQRGEHPHCARHMRWSADRPRRVGTEATHIPCSSRPRQPAPQPKSPVSPLSAEVTSSCRSPAAPGCPTTRMSVARRRPRHSNR